MALEMAEPQQEDCEVLQKKQNCQLIYDIKWSWRKTCHLRRDCTLQAHVQHDFGNFTPVDVIIKVMIAQELINHIVYWKLWDQTGDATAKVPRYTQNLHFANNEDDDKSKGKVLYAVWEHS